MDVKELESQHIKKANKQKLPFCEKWLDSMSVISVLATHSNQLLPQFAYNASKVRNITVHVQLLG